MAFRASEYHRPLQASITVEKAPIGYYARAAYKVTEPWSFLDPLRQTGVFWGWTRRSAWRNARHALGYPEIVERANERICR